MKKLLSLILILFAALIIFSGERGEALAEEKLPTANPSYYQKIPPAMLAAVRSAPAASGKTAFEYAAKEYNKLIDQNMRALPKADRPYIDALTVALICDSIIKSYRSGNTAAAEQIAWRVPVDMTVPEKIDLLELVTTAYIQAETKNR